MVTHMSPLDDKGQCKPQVCELNSIVKGSYIPAHPRVPATFTDDPLPVVVCVCA